MAGVASKRASQRASVARRAKADGLFQGIFSKMVMKMLLYDAGWVQSYFCLLSCPYCGQACSLCCCYGRCCCCCCCQCCFRDCLCYAVLYCGPKFHICTLLPNPVHALLSWCRLCRRTIAAQSEGLQPSMHNFPNSMSCEKRTDKRPKPTTQLIRVLYRCFCFC